MSIEVDYKKTDYGYYCLKKNVVEFIIDDVLQYTLQK